MPLDTWGKVIPLVMALFLCIYGRLKPLSKIKIATILLLVLTATLSRHFIPQPEIELGFNLFTPNLQSQVFELGLPQPVFNSFYQQFSSRFPKEQWCDPADTRCWNGGHRPSALWSFSAESIWKHSSLSTKRNYLIASNERDLGMGAINGVGYQAENTNWFDEYSDVQRSNVPIIVGLKILTPKYLEKICWKGSLWMQSGETPLASEFKSDGDCQLLAANTQDTFYYLMTPQHRLPFRKAWIKRIDSRTFFADRFLTPSRPEIEVKWSRAGNLLNEVKLAIPLICFLVILFSLFEAPALRSEATYLTMVSLIALFTSTHFFDFGGLITFPAADDGLVHAGFGRAILQYAIQSNWYEALKGVESVFYFMPGLRYLRASELTLFGETSFGYLILIFFYPFLFFALANEVLNDRKTSWAFTLFAVAMFLPGRIIRSAAYGFGEPAGYALFMIGLISILRWQKKSSPRYLILSALVFGIAVIVRPNLVLATTALSILIFYRLLMKRSWSDLFVFASASSLTLLPLLHNLWFGQKLVLLTSAATIPVNLLAPPSKYLSAARELLSLEIGQNIQFISSHLALWLSNNAGGLVILLIAYFLRKTYRSIDPDIWTLIFSVIPLQVVLIFWHPEGRYSYLAWIISYLLLFKLVTLYRFERLRQPGAMHLQ